MFGLRGFSSTSISLEARLVEVAREEKEDGAKAEAVTTRLRRRVICFSILDGLIADAQIVPKFVYESLPDPFDVAAFKGTLEETTSLDVAEAEKLIEGMTAGSNQMSKHFHKKP